MAYSYSTILLIKESWYTTIISNFLITSHRSWCVLLFLPQKNPFNVEPVISRFLMHPNRLFPIYTRLNIRGVIPVATLLKVNDTLMGAGVILTPTN